jgi:hypothetical protein
MAANTHLSIASWNLALNAALDVLNNGFVEIYDSTGTGQPATPDVAVTTQVKLAKLTFGATAFGAASAGTKTANAIGSVSALATGTATWFRAFKSDDTTAVIDGSVGTSGTDLVLNDVAITTGGTVQITSYSVSMPVGQ